MSKFSNNYKLIFSILLLLAVALVGCKNYSDKKINFFVKIENAINNKGFIKEIKFSSKDSLYKLTGIFNAIYKIKLAEDSAINDYWAGLIGNRFKDLHKLQTDEILLRAFQKYLNNEKIDFDKIKKDVVIASNTREIELVNIERKHRNELIKLILLNDSNTNIGDTINIYLPLEGEKDYYTIYYDQFPSTLKYTYPDNNLHIRGRLTSKFYDNNRTGFDSLPNSHPLNLFFKIEITGISNESSHFFGSKALKVGDSIDLPLNFYNTQIKQ